MASKIEWTETTWNPVTGCTKISPGCQNCYAERMAKRLQAMKSPNYANGFKLTCHPEALSIPNKWKRNRLVFVNSMSDLFHEDVPITFVKKVLMSIRFADQHQYQVLTKRSQRLREMSLGLKWPDNAWVGVSVENRDYVYRVEDLKQVEAAVRFLSIEPLIGAIPKIDLSGIDWVIVGGESGPGARPIKKEWVVDIRNQCELQGVPFFFKQWGGVNKKKTGRKLDGKLWSQMPKQLSVPFKPILQPAI